MAKKRFDEFAELKKVVVGKNVVFGTERTVKLLRQGKVKRVFMASNCSPEAKGNIAQYCKGGDVDCVELPQNNEELGALCKKPFAISVVAVTV